MPVRPENRIAQCSPRGNHTQFEAADARAIPETQMAKTMDQKREQKKKPAKTLQEKRAAKKEKHAKRGFMQTP
jgi:hypothetical protein